MNKYVNLKILFRGGDLMNLLFNLGNILKIKGLIENKITDKYITNAMININYNFKRSLVFIVI